MLWLGSAAPPEESDSLLERSSRCKEDVKTLGKRWKIAGKCAMLSVTAVADNDRCVSRSTGKSGTGTGGGYVLSSCRGVFDRIASQMLHKITPTLHVSLVA
jgi:hypothetical protein